jgi:phosphoribosylaminoimidazole (AIR) synthetase
MNPASVQLIPPHSWQNAGRMVSRARRSVGAMLAFVGDSIVLFESSGIHANG